MGGRSPCAIGAAAIGAAAMILLISAGPTNAQGQTPGWYIDVHAGPTILQDPKVHIEPMTADLKYQTNLGVGAGLSVGYQGLFVPGLRAEAEAVYRTNSVNGEVEVESGLVAQSCCIGHHRQRGLHG